MDTRRAVEAEYAALHGLTSEELATLRELLPYISRNVEEQQRGDGPPDENECCRFRYKAAEARYGRMKALVCASLEAQMRLKSRVSGQLVAETMRELGLGDADAVDAILGQRSIDESLRRQMVDEMHRLVCELKPTAALEGGAIRCESDIDLAMAQGKIFALELELNRLNDKAFEDDERLRECEDVFDRMLKLMPKPAADEPMVHRRFHPMATCSDSACQGYARRLRSGLRQSVAEAYVHDRNRRIHGHFRQYVEPLERLRLEKDREIGRLRFELARLERASGRMSADVSLGQLDMAIVCRKLEMDSLGAQAQRMREQIQELACERDRWHAAVQAEQGALREAEARIDENRNVHALLELQIQAFGVKKAEFERLAAQVEGLRRGGDGGAGRTKDDDDDAGGGGGFEEESHHRDPSGGGEKRAKQAPYLVRSGKQAVCCREGMIFVLCSCKEEVQRGGLEQHVAEAHGKALLCPHGCGFFIPASRPGRQTDMARHVQGRACAERMREIRRLEEEEGCV